MNRVHLCIVAAALVVSSACKLAPGKPFTWKSTVSTEFTVSDNQQLTLFTYQFGAPFQIGASAFKGKLQITVPRAEIASVPKQMDLSFVEFQGGSHGTTPVAAYTLSAALKMKPIGSDYRVSYTFNDRSVPAFDFTPIDYLEVDLKPSGGAIGPGWQVFGAYAVVPNKS
jgi:hypothetical protein